MGKTDRIGRGGGFGEGGFRKEELSEEGSKKKAKEFGKEKGTEGIWEG